MNHRQDFLRYLENKSPNASGTAKSYVRALDLLGEMIQAEPMGFLDCGDIWSVQSIERLEVLYETVLSEARRFTASPWNLPTHPSSYLQKSYCSAALRAFQSYLLENNHSKGLISIYQNHEGSEEELPAKLDKEIPVPDDLIAKITGLEGLDRVAECRTRINQGVFRSIILDLYKNTCCITDIDIPTVNRASHIIPWADSKETRMDPRNGLCLSATYDAAFDRYLISLDEDFRLIVSKDITSFFTSEAVKSHFLNFHGKSINLPAKFKPHPDFLREHRKRGSF